MKLLYIFIFFTIFGHLIGYGQSAEVFYHRGAQEYIDAKYTEARKTVEEGLLIHQNDVYLNMLAKLLDEIEKQQQNNKSQQDGNENKEDQDEKGDNSSQNENKDDKSQSEKQQDNQEKNENKDSQPEKNEDAKQDDKKAKPIIINKEEAEQILKALQQKERELLSSLKKKSTKPRPKNEKDW